MPRWPRVCTSIWEIEDKLDFGNIKQTRPWARRLQCLSTHDQGFASSICPITTGPGDCFCTPNGLVDPHRGLQQDLPIDLLGEEIDISLAYSGNGEVLYKYPRYRRNKDQMEKIFWTNSKPIVEKLDLSLWNSDLSLWNSDLSLSNSDPTFDLNMVLHHINHVGTFIVFETLRRTSWGFFLRRTYLVDTRQFTANKWLIFEEVTPDPDLACFCAFWNTSLILIRNRYEQVG